MVLLCHRAGLAAPAIRRAGSCGRGLLVGFLFIVTGLVQAATGLPVSEMRQLAQLAEYVGVDYPAAVIDGEIVSASEYQEMLEFSGILVDRTALAADHPDYQALNQVALALQQAVVDKAPAATISEHGAELRRQLLALMPTLTLPGELLPVATIEPLFQESCASCHGASGMGDGVLAAQFDPAPTNFHDRERADHRSLLGLFDAISNGIDDTAMAAYTQFSEQQRWSLAFYVGGLAYQDKRLDAINNLPVSLQEFVNQSPGQLLAAATPEQRAELLSLRADPQPLFAAPTDPLGIAREHLKAAMAAHQSGDYRLASDLAVSAYLDGFELTENSLDARDSTLRKAIEVNMMGLRKLMSHGGDNEALEAAYQQTLQQLEQADALLHDGNLSDATLFSASLVILLREGLEALLVVLALTTVLVKTQRGDALKYVHLGWAGALVAGIGTWIAAQSLITISGASREIMEGVAALLAAVVLFYVGIWMHSKTMATNWQAYIQRNISTHLKAGTLWGLAGLSFIAVYREVFETVLFYQALLTQAAATQVSSVLSGLIAGIALLAAIGWLLVRYSLRLPIGKFFSITTYLILALSFVLMGKAITALQEASLIGISPMPVNFELSWIGVKSTWQGILAQIAIVVLFLIFMARSRRVAHATAGA